MLNSKTIILTTDENVFVYTKVSGRMSMVGQLSWAEETFSTTLYNILKKTCKSRPIVILSDMVEQHYRKERVLKSGVGVFDRGSMLKRKLMAAFPNYPIRAALPLKENLGKQNLGSYIFVATPASEKMNKLISVTLMPEFSIVGYYLLPVESTDLVKTLSDKLLKKRKEKKTAWAIFIGQHKGGGLRQIVTRNGEMALTRLTPLSDMHSAPERWVLEAHQEFKATMSYLSRFGYEQTDGLNVIVLSSDECGQELENLIQEDCLFNTITLDHAASLLGVSVDVELGENYADTLHAAWVNKKGKLVLPMSVAAFEAVKQPRKIATYAMIAMALGGLYLGQQFLSLNAELSDTNKKIQKARIQRSEITEKYEDEVAKKAASGYDIKLLQGALDLYGRLENNKPDILALYKDIGDALGGNMRLNNIVIETPKNNIAEAIENAKLIPSEEDKEETIYKGKMTIIYPSTTDIDQGNRQIRSFKNKLTKKLPDHHVRVTKYLNDYEYSEQVVVESAQDREAQAQQDYVIEITFEKKREKEEDAQ